MKSKTICLITILFCFAVCSVRPQGAVSDNNINWGTIYRHGIGSLQPEARKLPRACPVVAQAIDAAGIRDFTLFCSLFLDVDSNHPPEQVLKWYHEWQDCSKQYIYLIVEDAIITNLNNGKHLNNTYSTVSIAPAFPKSLQQNNSNLPPVQPSVVFSCLTKDGWRLLPNVLDDNIEKIMMAHASSYVYKPTKYSHEAVAQESRRFHEGILEGMRKRGVPEEDIISRMETFQMAETVGQMKNWNDWTNYYKADVMATPVTFDKREPWQINYNDPVSALHSYLRAAFIGDARTLLKYADESAKKNLKRVMNVDESIKKNTYEVFNTNTLTRIYILMTATATVNGEKYVLVFWRAQNDEVPTHGFIALQNTTFLYKNGGYILTRNMEGSLLTSVLSMAQVNGAGLLKYTNFIQTMKKSSFPTNFYTIY
jgi:hypothetical protein